MPFPEIAVAARIAYHEHAVSGCLGCVHEVAQFLFVVWRRYGYVRDRAKVCKVESAVVSGAVVSHKPGTIQTQTHIDIQYRGIVYYVVVSPLGERRVYVAERHHSVLCHSGGERNGVPFGNAYVEHPFGHGFLHHAHGAAGGHCRRNAYDTRVPACKFQQRFPEHVLVFRPFVGEVFLDELSGFTVELPGIVPCRRLEFRRTVALALQCMDMKYFRAFHILDFAQGSHEFYDIVPVHRPEIPDVESLEDILLVGKERFQRIVEPYYRLAPCVVEESPVHQLLRQLEAQPVVCRGSVQVAQILSHSPHAPVYAHAVVVQDYQHVVGSGRYIVEPLERQSAAHCPVAYYRHHMPRGFPLTFGSHGHSERSRYGVRGMPAGKRVVFAFHRRRKRTQSAHLPVGQKTVAPPGEDFVCIGLMAHIPYKAVERCAENIVQGHGEFHHTET